MLVGVPKDLRWTSQGSSDTANQFPVSPYERMLGQTLVERKPLLLSGIVRSVGLDEVIRQFIR